VRLFPLWVLIDILSFVRLLLSQQPDNTHGIYQRPATPLYFFVFRW
jgi:hypothetical protein